MEAEDYEYRGMLASSWDLLRGDTSGWPDRAFYRNVIGWSGAPVLDVGCGTGAASRAGGGCTTRADRASAKREPSSPMRLRTSSDRPVTPTGTIICSPASPLIGTDQEPGAVT